MHTSDWIKQCKFYPLPALMSSEDEALLHEISSIPVIANSARLIGLQSQGN